MNCSKCGTAIVQVAGPYGLCHCQDALHKAIGVDRYQPIAMDPDLRNTFAGLAQLAGLAQQFAAIVSGQSRGGVDPGSFGVTHFSGRA